MLAIRGLVTGSACCKGHIAKKCLQRCLCGCTVASVNPMHHPSFPAIRHHELIQQSEDLRHQTAFRRLARAARLSRRAESLNRRAAEIVETTHQ